MPSIITRDLKRGYEPQEQTLPGNARPAHFMNRGGTPTVCILIPDSPTPNVVRSFILAKAASAVPKGAAYVGTAEFGGGTELLHLFEIPA